MSKTMSLPSRAIYIVIALALVLSLGLFGLVAQTSADPGVSKWTKVTTPSEVNKTLLPGSNLYDFAVGPDGDTVYVIGTKWDDDGDEVIESGEMVPALWKSADGGASWKDISAKLSDDNVKNGLPGDNDFEVLTQVALAPDDADFLAVAGTLESSGLPAVVGSNDGGSSFYYTGSLPTGATAKILSMDVSRKVDGIYNLALGSDDGKVCRYQAGTFWGGSWSDASGSGYPGWETSTAVTSVAFSPSWSADRTVLAISTDGSGSWLQSGMWGTHMGWGGVVERAPKVQFKVGTAAINPVDIFPGVTGIALPSDYNGYDGAMRVVYVYMNTDDVATDGGYVFIINNTNLSAPFGPGGNPWLASMAYYGTIDEGDAMLGEMVTGAGNAAPSWPPTSAFDCCTGVRVWRSDNFDVCCPDWHSSRKAPSGQSYAIVAFTPDGMKAYATTQDEGMARESAFSVSLDKGNCWNQIGLIDTIIESLSDFASSPDCSVDYLSTKNKEQKQKKMRCDSVWMMDDNADHYDGVWQRVYHKALEGDDEMGLLRLAPEHDDGDVVYWGDQDTENLFWASGKGICGWNSRKSNLDIQDFALADEDTVYVVDKGGDVSKYIGGTHDWSKGVDSTVATGHSIAVLGDHVLVGGTNSKVGYSDDGASSFTDLDKALSGDVHVAFDSYFESNDTIYVAVADGSDSGIWRWVIGDSSEWRNLGAKPYDYFGIVMDYADGNPMTDATHGGVLYASAVGIEDDGDVFSGVARNLTPAETACCGGESWDYLHAGLGDGPAEDFNLEPVSLKKCGCLESTSNTNLFAIDNDDYVMADGSDGSLWGYEDCFAKAAPELTGPSDGSTIPSDPCVCDNEEIVLKWDRQCNACSYDWQISMDDKFTEVVESDFDYEPPSGAHPADVIPEGALDCNETYYWHVRSADAETGEEIHSFWSDTWEFTVEAGPGGAASVGGPENGASNVGVSKPGFSWTAVAEATGYDFVLSENADLSSPVVSKTGLKTTALTYDGTLDYSTSYFWQVTAKKGANVLSKTPVATFTTAAEPVEPEPPVVVHEYPPAEPVTPTTPTWVWVVIGIGAVLVIVVIVLIFRTRRV